MLLHNAVSQGLGRCLTQGMLCVYKLQLSELICKDEHDVPME